MRGLLHTDGGARGNPGPAGIGVVLRDDSGEVIAVIARSIGTATNNVAEYTALIQGLKLAAERGVTDIKVHLDSKLVVAQVTGVWKIRSAPLRRLAVEARRLLESFERFDVVHVGRDHNADADRLANQGMDEAEPDAGDDPGTSTQGSLLS